MTPRRLDTGSRALVIVALAILGATIGVGYVRLRSTTNDGVRAAARMLVPDDFAVVYENSGHIGSFPPPKGPFFVQLELVAAGTAEDRVKQVLDEASDEGWAVERVESPVGGFVVRLAPRRDLEARVYVFRYSEEATVMVQRPSTAARQISWGLGGAVLGVVVSGWFAPTRARRAELH